jgi:ribokinase
VIVVFGSINVDLVARVPRFPRPGETLTGESFAVLPGGKGANQALAARRAGADVALVGAVGADAFASTALATLVSAGVDVSRVRRTGGSSGVALIQVDAQGENSITVIPGANADADPVDVLDAMVGSDNTLVMQLELPLAAVHAMTLRARSHGARIILNAAPARALPAEVLGALDVLVVNEIEAARVSGEDHVDASAESCARTLHRRYGCATVVTLGAQGALAVAEGRLLRLPAPEVRVVDTTGAGDALTGALAAALDRGSAWPRALAEGVAAGSLACAAEGAQSELPDAAAIRTLAATLESALVDHILD